MQRTTKFPRTPGPFPLQAVFQDARTITGTRLVFTFTGTPVRCRRTTAVYFGSTYGLCPWNLIQNLIYLNYYGDKKQGEESSDDYCHLVMILHSSTGLVNWLSRTTATRIWVANTKTRRPGKARAVEEFHPLSGTAEDYRGQGSHHSQS